MALCNILLVLGLVSALRLTAAGPVEKSRGFDIPNRAKEQAPDLVKAKNVDMSHATSLVRAVMKDGQYLLNPCNLFDTVQDDMKKAPQKTKLKPVTGAEAPPAGALTRRMVFDMALPSIRDGISLYRTTFVLQETSNLTVFLDQNRDGIYSNTSLRSYSHYYVRAANEEITQILFVGLIKNDDVSKRGMESPAMGFLAANGLIRHPRQYVDFETIPRQEADLILQKRQQMADLLNTQGTFWENDHDYLTGMLTLAFNGPENETELAAVMPKIMKNYVHKMQEAVPVITEDLYEDVCLREKMQKASDDAALETVALFAL